MCRLPWAPHGAQRPFLDERIDIHGIPCSKVLGWKNDIWNETNGFRMSKVFWQMKKSETRCGKGYCVGGQRTQYHPPSYPKWIKNNLWMAKWHVLELSDSCHQSIGTMKHSISFPSVLSFSPNLKQAFSCGTPWWEHQRVMSFRKVVVGFILKVVTCSPLAPSAIT